MDLNMHGAAQRRLKSKPVAIALALALLGTASSASAFFDDRLQVFAGETVTHDSNVFRISDGVNPQGVIGSSERSDTWYDTAVGVRLDTPISRQRIQAGLNLSQVRYDRFTALNHLDRNGNVNWLWQATDRASGQLGYTETHTIASFSNFTGPVPNPLTTKVLSGTANFLVDPRWELQAIGSDMRQRNGLAVRRPNDIDLTSLQLGANFISAASNRIGINVRQDDGHYPTLEPLGALLINNDYVQRSIGAMADWTVTAKSHVAARIDHIQRDYEAVSDRNYTGTTFRAAYDWLATSKTSLSVIAQRDISSSEDVQTSFVLAKGLSVTPSYAFSEKVRLTGTLSSYIREYLGGANVAASPLSFVGRVDHIHAGSLSLSYQALRSLTMFVSAQRENRTSNFPLLDYDTNIFEVSARLTF